MARSRPTAATDAQRQRILDAAEVVLRRYGPSKTNVVDVARELGQTHASVYRYFASKADLVDALIERWLHRISDPLAAIAHGPEPAPDRFRAWMLALFRAKVQKIRAEPEYFATYHALTGGSDVVTNRHIADLVGQVETILAAGAATGAFQVADLPRAARAVFQAMYRFHHPALLAPPAPIPTEAEVEQVVALLIAGLRAGVV